MLLIKQSSSLCGQELHVVSDCLKTDPIQVAFVSSTRFITRSAAQVRYL